MTWRRGRKTKAYVPGREIYGKLRRWGPQLFAGICRSRCRGESVVITLGRLVEL